MASIGNNIITLNTLKNCDNCGIETPYLLWKECNKKFCHSCQAKIHNEKNNLNHSAPSPLLINLEEIKFLFLNQRKFINYSGKFRNGFHNPNDAPNYVSKPLGKHTSIICDKNLENNNIYKITFKIRKPYNDGKGSWCLIGIAEEAVHGKRWDSTGTKNYFFHCYNSYLYTEKEKMINDNYLLPKGRRLQANDVVCLIVDLYRREMIVEINGISCGVAFSHIPNGIDLYPTISPFGDAEEIELIY